MRIEVVKVKTMAAARKLMPWAARIVKVVDGYMGFESIDSYHTWKNQK